MKISVPKFGTCMFRIIMLPWLTVFDENEGTPLPFLVTCSLRSFRSGIVIVMPTVFPHLVGFEWVCPSFSKAVTFSNEICVTFGQQICGFIS